MCAQVDVFGACGQTCADGCDSAQLGRRYWFALALENSRCSHYVTEKYWGKLNADALPVVNGGLHGERDYLEIGALLASSRPPPPPPSRTRTRMRTRSLASNAGSTRTLERHFQRKTRRCHSHTSSDDRWNVSYCTI